MAVSNSRARRLLRPAPLWAACWSAGSGLALPSASQPFCSTAAVYLLRGLREPPSSPSRRHLLEELREGTAFAYRHALLRPVLVTQVIFNIAFFMLQSVYVPYAIHDLGLSAVGVGLTLACFGLGLVIGAFFAARIMAVIRFGLVVAIGPVAGLLASVLMALTIWLPFGWLAGLSFFVMGAGPILWSVSTTTLRQMVTPAALLGRVSALSSMTYGARPIGAGLGRARRRPLWGKALPDPRRRRVCNPGPDHPALARAGARCRIGNGVTPSNSSASRGVRTIDGSPTFSAETNLAKDLIR